MSRRNTSDTSLLDTVARAIFHAQQVNIWGGSDDEETYHWKSVSEGRKQMYQEMAQAAIHAMEAQEQHAESEQVA